MYLKCFKHVVLVFAIFVCSDYLSQANMHKVAVVDEMERRGSVGRLTIPSVGVNVALFETSSFDVKHSQPIVDRRDSAAYLSDSVRSYGFTLIGDHAYQGFSRIKKAVPGKTLACVDTGTNKTYFRCVDVFVGYNWGGLHDKDGKEIAGRNDGGICMYTCNLDETVTITFWQPVS